MNEREFKAWQRSVDDNYRKASKREKVLRKFDITRDEVHIHKP